MGGYAIFGMNPKTGRRYVARTSSAAAGAAAVRGRRVVAVSMCQGDVKNTPIECRSLSYPLAYEGHRAAGATVGGAGKFSRRPVGVFASKLLDVARSPTSGSRRNTDGIQAARRGVCSAAAQGQTNATLRRARQRQAGKHTSGKIQPPAGCVAGARP
jgi:N-methylhydantoinase B